MQIKEFASLANLIAVLQTHAMVPLSFANQEFALTTSGSLFWREESALLVADLHLEKASFYAKHGQMLPPYDSRETLGRVAEAIRETGARRVFTLGDNFHDSEGSGRLEPHAAGMLAALTRAVDWVWITGNHDPDMDVPRGSSTGLGPSGGQIAEELEVAGIILRHQAKTGETRPEFSGHYHPKLQVNVRKRFIRRPCAVVSSGVNGGRMILPAFGALTGGMDAADPVILDAMQPAERIDAVLPAGGKLVQFPLWRSGSLA